MSYGDAKRGFTRVCLDFKALPTRLGNFPQRQAKPLNFIRNPRFTNEYENGLVVAFTTNRDQQVLAWQ